MIIATQRNYQYYKKIYNNARLIFIMKYIELDVQIGDTFYEKL